MSHKKLFAVIIAIVTIVSLSACARDAEEASPENNNNTALELESETTDETVPTETPELEPIIDSEALEIPEGSDEWNDDEWEDWFNQGTDEDWDDIFDEVSAPYESEDSMFTNVSAKPVSMRDILSKTSATDTLTEQQIREIFASEHPNATILKLILKDNGVYYVYGMDNSKKCKMVIDAQTGEFYLNAQNYTNNPHVNTPSNDQTLESSEASSNDASSTLSGEDRAREIFANSYPAANILKIVLQDNASTYYIYGENGDNLYKMKVDAETGTIFYSYSGRKNGNNESSASNNEATSTNTGSVSQEQAKELYLSYYPSAPIDFIEQQDGGEVYYIQGISGNTKYMMKVRISDGSIIMNKSVNIGGNGDYNNNNNNNSNNSSHSDTNSGATKHVDSNTGATSRGR